MDNPFTKCACGVEIIEAHHPTLGMIYLDPMIPTYRMTARLKPDMTWETVAEKFKFIDAVFAGHICLKTPSPVSQDDMSF